MSGKMVATIYFYVISAASLVLIIIGVFNGVNLFINSTQYSQYPLKYNQPDCSINPYRYGGPIAAPIDYKIATPSTLDVEKQKQACLTMEEADRKQHKIDDMKNTLTFTLVGIILFAIHFPQARKYSKS